MDLGVAGALTEVDAALGRTTIAGELFGTPRYMAPEQITGAPQSAATDLWAAAALFFEMRAARPLFDAMSVAELFAQILGSPEIPVTLELDSAAEQFLRACLQREPAARPKSADAAAALLRGDGPLAGGASAVGAAREAPPAPAGMRSPPPMLFLIVTGVLLAVASAAAAAFFLHQKEFTIDPSVLAGLGMVALGATLVPLGLWLTRRLTLRTLSERARLTSRASALLVDARARDALSQTMAFEIDRLQERCRSVDERFMTATVALMLHEYREAASFDDRQKALLNAVQILEKVTGRIEPWYLKHDQMLSRGLSVMTILTGLIAAAQGIRKLLE